jgi:membrane protease YdiL (CAAX protease family)
MNEDANAQGADLETLNSPDAEIRLLRSRTPPAILTDWAAIVFAMVLPTIVTLVYFLWLKDAESSLQQSAMGIGKVIQFGFPFVWVWLWYRGTFRKTAQPVSGGQIGFAIGFGLAVVAVMFLLFFFVIEPAGLADGLTELVKEKVGGLGIDAVWKYVALGVFYSLCHAFLEEYYWRWFVFDYLKKVTSTLTANIVSSLGFMAHHVIVLGYFFGWTSPLAYALSLCIAVGGMVWAWQYDRTDRLVAPWISHMIVDAGIFTLGYFLIRDLLI